jgi:hypothetical protein
MATALPNQLEQATTRVFVVFMHLEMLDQLIDPSGQKRNLHFRRAGVCRMNLMLFDYGLLFTLREWHNRSPFLRVKAAIRSTLPHPDVLLYHIYS